MPDLWLTAIPTYMSVSNVSNPFANIAYHHPSPWDTQFEPMALPEMFARTTRNFPNAPLAHFMGRTYSYSELFSDAQRFALALKANGIVEGDRVGLFLPNVPIYVSAYYGAMMAGAVVVNFSPLYSVEELAQQVADSGSRTLVTVDVPELFGTAESVLHESKLETLIVGQLSSMLPTLKGVAMKFSYLFTIFWLFLPLIDALPLSPLGLHHCWVLSHLGLHLCWVLVRYCWVFLCFYPFVGVFFLIFFFLFYFFLFPSVYAPSSVFFSLLFLLSLFHFRLG